jgi:hypothetical protein
VAVLVVLKVLAVALAGMVLMGRAEAEVVLLGRLVHS